MKDVTMKPVQPIKKRNSVRSAFSSSLPVMRTRGDSMVILSLANISNISSRFAGKIARIIEDGECSFSMTNGKVENKLYRLGSSYVWTRQSKNENGTALIDGTINETVLRMDSLKLRVDGNVRLFGDMPFVGSCKSLKFNGMSYPVNNQMVAKEPSSSYVWTGKRVIQGVEEL